MELTDLRTFVKINEVGSISGAARVLRSPKSSVSRSLVRLEEQIGAVLIERSTRHLRLTDAGLLLHRHAARILDEVGEAESAIGGLTGVPNGTLRVSVPFTFATGPLAPMLPLFLSCYPEVRVVLAIDNRPVDVAIEEVDIAIRIGPVGESQLIARRLATFPLQLYASPAYLVENGTPKTVNDLAQHRLIASMDQRYVWRFTPTKGAVQEFEIVPATVVSEPTVARTMIIAGAGIARLPSFHALDAVASGELVRILPHLEGDTVDAHAMYASHRSISAKVRVFVDALVAHMAETTTR
jgi:DNA-binding transcriptional LysR family regulator